MRTQLLILFYLLFFHNVYGQQKVQLFSEEIKNHIGKFKHFSDIAYEKGDIEKGQLLFDSLVQNYLVGTKIDNYVLKCANGKKVKLQKIKKPIFLLTYSSWCVLNKAEIQSLNELSKKYTADFQLIVLFWDTKKNMKKLATKFNNNINVCYANEEYEADEEVVSNLKHYLGFPTSYFMNKNLEIIDILRGNPQVPIKTSFAKTLDYNLAFFEERITNFLIQKDVIMQPYVKNEY